jgi:hypothetical protein
MSNATQQDNLSTKQLSPALAMRERGRSSLAQAINEKLASFSSKVCTVCGAVTNVGDPHNCPGESS